MEPVRPDVTGADRIGIQAELAIPLIEALEAELGTEAAHAIVRRVVAEQTATEARAAFASTGRTKLALRVLAEPHVDAVAPEYLPTGKDRFEFDVVSCGYARLFQELGRPDLGAMLLCEADEHAVAVLPGVELTRPTTIMSGGDRCRFRYRFDEG